MPNILFASNNKAHWPLSASSTTNGEADYTRVPYALQLAHGETIVSPQWIPTSGDVTWLHHRMYMNSYTTTDTPILIRIFDTNGNVLASVDKKYNIASFITILTLYRDGGTVTIEQTFPFNRYQVNSVDLRYENNGTNLVSCGLYVNGGLAALATHASPPSFGQPAYMSVGACFRDSGSGSNALSEFIVADGDTRNARLDLIRPVASGGETDWVGLAAELADDDPTSGMTSITAEERQTLTLETYNGANNISAIVIATQSVAGANGPQNLRHTVRMSAVNYDSPSDLPMGAVLEYQLTDFLINPATSLPWVGSDLASMEMGFISKT